MGELIRPKWMVVLVIVAMTTTFVYVVVLSRQSVQAGADMRSSSHVRRVERALQETEKAVYGNGAAGRHSRIGTDGGE